MQAMLEDQMSPGPEARPNTILVDTPPDARQLKSWRTENRRRLRRILAQPIMLDYSLKDHHVRVSTTGPPRADDPSWRGGEKIVIPPGESAVVCDRDGVIVLIVLRDFIRGSSLANVNRNTRAFMDYELGGKPLNPEACGSPVPRAASLADASSPDGVASVTPAPAPAVPSVVVAPPAETAPSRSTQKPRAVNKKLVAALAKLSARGPGNPVLYWCGHCGLLARHPYKRRCARVKMPCNTMKKVRAIVKRRSAAGRKPRHDEDTYLKSSGVWGDVHLVKAWHAQGHELSDPFGPNRELLGHTSTIEFSHRLLFLDSYFPLAYRINHLLSLAHPDFSRLLRDARPLLLTIRMLGRSFGGNSAPARRSWPLKGQSRTRTGSRTPKCRISAAFLHFAGMLALSKIPAIPAPQNSSQLDDI
ncbi:hypothetical protein BDV93DRAFT_566047 [Ceratobasidium sp. AG-I]|nr:hypothetical protein BDV93DRAFT_566047 [Ceratobasidium sp. AG-I]